MILTLRFHQILDTFKLTPFDTSTEEGRSKERNRRIALAALASGAAKALTILTSFITVPLTLNYLGTERYGLWMTISSVIAMMFFADFGIGNGLMNAVSEAHGKDDMRSLRTHVTNAFVILIGIAMLVLFGFFLVYPFVHWGPFFNVRTPVAVRESGPALAVLMICFAAGIPAGIVQRVQMGLQQGFESSLWQAGGSAVGLLATLLVIQLNCGLPWLVAAMAGTPVVMSAVNGLLYFGIRNRHLLPERGLIAQDGIGRILRGGLLFFILQICVSVSFASDNLIIAKIIGADAVSQYSIVSKLFEGVLMVMGLAVAPLWPAYGEAKARGDRLWINATLIRSMLLTLLVLLVAAASVILMYKQIFTLWVGAKHIFSFSLVVLYAIWMILKGLGATYSMFLNGMNVIRMQVILSTLFMFFSICMKIVLANNYGINGILIALMTCYTVIIVIPYLLFTKKMLVDI